MGHRCKNQELRVLMAHDDEINRSEGGDVEGGTEPTEEVGEIVELSLNTVVGFSMLGTMKLKGEINQTEVVLLMDCGATHNLIAQKLVKTLNLLTADTLNYRVIMGTGVAVEGRVISQGGNVEAPRTYCK